MNMWELVEEESNKRKHLTRACVACKQRHHKCSGTTPCAYCKAKNQQCVYDVQAKRGPKAKNNPYPLPSHFSSPSPFPSVPSPSFSCTSSSSSSSSPAILSSALSSSSSALSYSFYASMSSSHISSCSPSHLSSVETEQESSNTAVPYNRFEITLWRENERMKSVESFLELRSWWKSLLHQDSLQSADSVELQVQCLIIGAQMHRFQKDNTRASSLFNSAQNLLSTVDEYTAEYACSLILMIDYLPSELTNLLSSSMWSKIKNHTVTSHREQRVFSYLSMAFLTITENETEKNEIYDHLDTFTMNKYSADVWDIVLAYIYQLSKLFMRTLRPITRFFSEVQVAQMSIEQLEKATDDIKLIEWIIQRNEDVFGDEFNISIFGLKAVIFWKKGALNNAVAEVVKYLCAIRKFGNRIIFLGDISYLSFPLLVLQEAGMWNLLREGLDLISSIAFATDQHDLYSEVVTFFYATEGPQALPPPQNSNDYTINNDFNNNTNIGDDVHYDINNFPFFTIENK